MINNELLKLLNILIDSNIFISKNIHNHLLDLSIYINIVKYPMNYVIHNSLLTCQYQIYFDNLNTPRN
jgi:hypothetical protein